MPDNAVQENWLTRIGGLRDGFLVMASVIYGTGYLVWSLQAWRLGLGLLPALDAQYFAAGFIPVLVVIAAIYVFNLANELLKRLLTWLHSEPRTSGKSAVGTAAYVLSIAPIAFLLVANSSGFLEQIIPWEWAIPIVIVALLLGSLLSPSKIGGIESKPNRLYRVFQLGNVIFGGAAIAVVYFIGSVYPYIPQELGGLRARCAYIDLHKDQLSTFTLSALTAVAELSSTPIIRTKRLEIFYASSDVVMVGLDNRVYELDKATIEAISSCDELN